MGKLHLKQKICYLETYTGDKDGKMSVMLLEKGTWRLECSLSLMLVASVLTSVF